MQILCRVSKAGLSALTVHTVGAGDFMSSSRYAAPCRGWVGWCSARVCITATTICLTGDVQLACASAPPPYAWQCLGIIACAVFLDQASAVEYQIKSLFSGENKGEVEQGEQVCCKASLSYGNPNHTRECGLICPLGENVAW